MKNIEYLLIFSLTLTLSLSHHVKYCTLVLPCYIPEVCRNQDEHSEPSLDPCIAEAGDKMSRK